MATRALEEWYASRRLAAATSNLGMDVLWVTIPTMFLLPEALRAASRARARCVADVRDLTWEYALDSKAVGRTLRFGPGPLLRRWMTSSLRRFDAVVVTNEGAREALIRVGVEERRLTVLPNGIDRARYSELVKTADPRSSHPFVVTYCGLVGHNQGLGSLLETASRLPDVTFNIAGDGPELAALAEVTRARRLGNVKLLGQLPWAEVKALYEGSHVLFAQLRSQASLSATAIPSKLVEYMAARRPVLYAGAGVGADFVKSVGAGVVVPAEDAETITEVVRELRGSPAARERMAVAGRLAASRLIREDLTATVTAQVLQDLTTHRAA